MKRFLAVLLLLISMAVLSVWVSTTPESLPSQDTSWHAFKRNLFMQMLACKRDRYANNHVPLSKAKIDVVILALEKDLPTVGHAIDAARGLVMHPINKVYLICPESEQLRAVALAKGCDFVEANQAMPIFANGKQVPDHLKRQFITLNAETICASDYYLVIDANTILLQTQIFLRNDKAVLNAVDGYALERKVMVESLLKLKKYHNLSFAGHHMFFDKAKLKALKKHFEALHKQSWQDVLNNQNITPQNFSEYEMYADFVLTFFPNEVMVVYGRNAAMPATHAHGIEWQRGFLSKRYASLSFN